MLFSCPKCQQVNARYLAEDDELFIKCQCGYLKCVYSERGTTTVQHTVPFESVHLPSEGTLVHRLLMAVVDAYPKERTTRELCESVPDLNYKAGSGILGVLAHRKLVVRVLDGNGRKGGSTWLLSRDACEFFGLTTRRRA